MAKHMYILLVLLLRQLNKCIAICTYSQQSIPLGRRQRQTGGYACSASSSFACSRRVHACVPSTRPLHSGEAANTALHACAGRPLLVKKSCLNSSRCTQTAHLHGSRLPVGIKLLVYYHSSVLLRYIAAELHCC